VIIVTPRFLLAYSIFAFIGDSMAGRNGVLEFPIVVEKDEDGFYVVECPVLEGCYSQGETIDAALKNIREVVGLCLCAAKTKGLIHQHLL
jgi:predicted RNase H-like HicB family nuclease